MASSSSKECVSDKLLAEEMLKCLLIDSNVPWNPSWGFQIETSVSIDELLREVLEDLNVCRERISEFVSIASRSFRSVVVKAVSDIWDHASRNYLVLPILIRVGESHHNFFTFMAIAKDLCIRFHREEKSQLIADVLEAVVYFMDAMFVFDPVLLRISIEDFMLELYFAEEILKFLLIDSNIPWNPSWGFQIEMSASIDSVARKVLKHLKACHEFISKCISIVSRRDRTTVVDEVTYVLNRSDKDRLSESLIAVGESSRCFFTFMAIANDLCIRLHREEKSHLIADVLKTVVYFMENMNISHPELFIREASDFIARHEP